MAAIICFNIGWQDISIGAVVVGIVW